MCSLHQNGVCSSAGAKYVLCEYPEAVVMLAVTCVLVKRKARRLHLRHERMFIYLYIYIYYVNVRMYVYTGKGPRYSRNGRMLHSLVVMYETRRTREGPRKHHSIVRYINIYIYWYTNTHTSICIYYFDSQKAKGHCVYLNVYLGSGELLPYGSKPSIDV